MKKILLSLALITPLSASYTLAANTGVTLYRIKDALLVRAAANGNEALVLTLLELGVDSSTQDRSGKTALHYSSERGLLALSQALLSSGADNTIKDDAGETARSLAQKAGQHELELLLGA